MAIIGFSALVFMLVIIISGYIFEGGAVAVAIGVILLTVTVISRKFREVTVLLYLSASLLFSGILMIAHSDCSLDATESVSGKNVNVVARVTGEYESHPSKTVYILQTESVNGVDVNVKLRLISNSAVSIYAGDMISFTSNVYSVDFFEDNFRRFYMSEGIYLGANIYKGDEDITIIKDGSETVACKLQRIRDEVKSRIFSVLPNERGAVAVAMLLGDRSAVSDETLDSFRGSGVYHLFAVSGLHLSIWVLGIYTFLKKLGVSRRFNSLLAVFVTIAFMAMTGFTASVTRAGIMLIVLMTGDLFKRKANTLNSLGFSLFIILAANPMAAASVSLLLSFSATLGIVTVYSYIDKAFEEKLNVIKNRKLNKIINSVISVFFVSLSAGIFTLPINGIAFKEVCLIGPITNVLISYAATIMMIAAGGIALLIGVPFGANLCGFICGIISEYIIRISSALSNFSFSCIKTDSMIFGAFLILSLSVVACCLILNKNKATMLRSIVAGVVCVCILCGCVHIVYNHNLTTVKVMDVDDGICLVTEHAGEKVVIGCGSSDPYCSQDVSFEIYKNASLLIVPDSNDWNSALVTDLTREINFDRIISGELIEKTETIVQPDFVLNPWSDASIEFHKTPEITYAYCVFGTSDILIVFDSAQGSDFSDHLQADVLICSYYLPENMDLSGFGNIIISSTKEVGEDMINCYGSENPNICSTLGEYELTLNMRKNKDVVIGR